MTEKVFVKKLMIAIISVFMLITAIMVICDPYFLYHGPNGIFSYAMKEKDERYINYGISKYFEYDAIITGTSMAENFRASQFDELFGVNSIKTCFSGGTHKVVGDYLRQALAGKNVEIVIRSLDLNYITYDKDRIKSGYDDPQYMYDDNIFNDVNYVLNKDMLFDVNMNNCILPTIRGEETTNFDDYANWMSGVKFGLEAVKKTYTRPNSEDVARNTNMEVLRENMEQNITSIAEENLDVEFNLFIAPYSIMYFDELNQLGQIEEYFDELECILEILFEHENIYVHSFLDEYETICDLDIYRDTTHYREEINDVLMVKLAEGTSIVNKENYKKHLEELEEFYSNYDYDQYFLMFDNDM